eukprot:scaffold94822_cov25-Tisochrysis_lutea.AAC.6
MGLTKCVLKCACSPRYPGMRKSKSDHISKVSFWMGVPESTRRCAPLSDFAARATFEAAFLMTWPSSRTM